ncbi:MAG: YtxH domain-containing protein [Acidobacteria bacterium]|nr:YtxH domain-containing protein [Acidobacteriota bacterium]
MAVGGTFSMYSEIEENSGKALWFVAGVAVGATIALLFAPSSGRVTRRRIGRAAERGRDSLADTGRDLAEKGKDLYEKGRRLADEAADMIDRGKKLVEG